MNHSKIKQKAPHYKGGGVIKIGEMNYGNDDIERNTGRNNESSIT